MGRLERSKKEQKGKGCCVAINLSVLVCKLGISFCGWLVGSAFTDVFSLLFSPAGFQVLEALGRECP